MKYFEEKMTYPQFLKYLVPSVLTMIFLSFYTTIDGFFVSRYAGSDALAGINIVIPITCVIFGTAVMLATGSGAIIGEKMGQKRERNLAVFAVDFADLKRYNAPMKCGTPHGTEERSRQP